MDSNNYYDEDEYISITNLLAYVFRRLKKLLIISIVIGLVSGVVFAYKNTRGNSEGDTSTYAVSRKILNDKIEELNADLNEYISENKFFELSPSNSVHVKALYYVNVDNDLKNDYLLALINSYVTELNSSDTLKELADKYKINEKYVSDYLYICSDVKKEISNGQIEINIYYKDEKVAKEILNDLETKLADAHDDLVTSIGDNTITLVSENVYTGVSNDVTLKQQEKIDYIKSYITSITEVKTQLDALDITNETVNVSFSKTFIKYGLIGFVGSFFVLCVFYAFVYIFGGKVYSADEFKDKTKIRVLGNLTYDKNNSKYLNWINKLEKRPTSNDYDLIASNIKAYGKSSKLLLSGDVCDVVKADVVANLKKRLANVEIISCNSLLSDANAINALKDVDGVVLLVKCHDSSYKLIKEEKDKLDDLKVDNVYAIVVE